MNAATTPVDGVALNAALKLPTSPRKEAPGIAKRTSAYTAMPSAIKRTPGFNPRFDFGDIEDLARSIKANGLIQPLQVKRVGEGFELVDGDRRFTAIELILKTEPTYFDAEGVPIIIVDKKLTEPELLVRMFEANAYKAFLPLEEAAAYKKMRDSGMSLKQIGAAVSRKHVHIVATLALLDADQSVKDGVKDGTINSTLAKQIAVAARGDKAKQRELATEAKAAGKDSKKRKAVKAKVEATRVAKAKKEGRVLKIRALTDEQLSAIGEKLAQQLTEAMVALGLEPETNMEDWVKAADADVKVAFSFGALQGLKAAAGVPVELVV